MAAGPVVLITSIQRTYHNRTTKQHTYKKYLNKVNIVDVTDRQVDYIQTSSVNVKMTSTFDREGSGSSDTSTLATPE